MMRNKLFALLLGMLAPMSWAAAWTVTPTSVSFVSQQGLVIPGKLFKPAGDGPFRAVVMLHGCSGIYSYSDPARGVATLYREWGDRLVAAGYVALLADSFSPRGTQNECSNSSAGVSEVYDRPYDANAAYSYLAQQSYIKPGSVGVLGWSHGGSSVLATLERTWIGSDTKPFKAAVAFYPGCGLYNAFGGVSSSTYVPYGPLRILHGSEDPLYQSGDCTTRINNAQAYGASSATGNPMDMTVYAGAHHSFDQANSSDPKPDQKAKTAADSAALTYLGTYLK